MLTYNPVNNLDFDHIQMVVDSFAESIANSHLYYIQTELKLAHNFANNHVLGSFDRIHHYLWIIQLKIFFWTRFYFLVAIRQLLNTFDINQMFSFFLFTLGTVVIALLMLNLRHRIGIAVVEIGLWLWLLMMTRWPLHVGGRSLWTRRTLWPLWALHILRWILL